MAKHMEAEGLEPGDQEVFALLDEAQAPYAEALEVIESEADRLDRQLEQYGVRGWDYPLGFSPTYRRT